MKNTRSTWLNTAARTGWFSLSRHEDPDPADPEPTDPADPADPDPGPDPDDPADPEPEPKEPDEPAGDGLGDAGKKALERMKAERAEAKRAAAAEKKRADELARKVQEFEDRDKSELERAQAKAERAQDQAAKAVARSVRSEIKVVAAGQFADPSDATDVLMRDPSKYVDADGEVDTDAIEADLAALLERKPHWAKPAPAPEPDPVPAAEPETARRQRPKPDPGQGSRGGPKPVDFMQASREEVTAELAKYGYRQRSL